MEIMGTDKYIGENINIVPVTKTRLGNERYPKIRECEGWKTMLKTGDVVRIESLSLDKKQHYYQQFVFVTFDDYFKYNYGKYTERGFTGINKTNEKAKEGILIKNDTTRINSSSEWTYLFLFYFYDSRMATAMDYIGHICGIYRFPNTVQPLSQDVFDTKRNLKDAFVLYENGDIITEKVSISPITKTRLGFAEIPIEEKLGWKNRLRTGDCAQIFTFDNFGNYEAVYIYISDSDIEKYNYKENLHIRFTDILGTYGGVFLRFEGDFSSYKKLSRFENNKMEAFIGTEKRAVINKIWRKRGIVHPMTVDYIKDYLAETSDSIVLFDRNEQIDKK